MLSGGVPHQAAVAAAHVATNPRGLGWVVVGALQPGRFIESDDSATLRAGPRGSVRRSPGPAPVCRRPPGA